jgi:hypothetical protein
VSTGGGSDERGAEREKHARTHYLQLSRLESRCKCVHVSFEVAYIVRRQACIVRVQVAALAQHKSTEVNCLELHCEPENACISAARCLCQAN